jgi:hypothetical protein
MTQLRERWTGVSLPGDYLLQQWLSGDEAAGFFETSVASDGRRAVVKLVPESAAVDGAAQLALWQRTRSLRHPNLLQLLNCGRAELSSETAVYAVFEYAGDTLASALANSPLSEAEAREVLDAVVQAVDYLRVQGLAHPGLDPERVLAVGEAIKLSTDALREASPDTPYTGELRAFWNRISPSTPVRSADILAQALAAHLHTGPAPARAEIAPAAEATVRTAPPAPGPQAPRHFPKWPLLGAAGIVLLILGLRLRPAPETPAHSSPQPLPPPLSMTGTIPKSSKAEDRNSPSVARTAMWRVIAFTYRTHDAAARMAGQINQRHPDFQAAVFSPPQKKGYFLVSLRGPMSRADAVRLQGKARAERLARDVYVKKFLD